MEPAIAVLLLAPLLLVALPVCLYLALLTLAAPFGLRRRTASTGATRRFAVLIPAHDEEAVIGRLLDSLAALDYPAACVDVHVVADNCRDRTAALARAAGATVFERHDEQDKGKGHALSWLLAQLEERDARYDAYVVIDADSVVSPNFLRAMNDRLDAGATVIQCYYTVLPLRGSVAESLREASLALVHYLRPAAKSALGASAGLKGNGMCFARPVVERFGWPTAGLAEDVEFHLMLVAAGIRVTFAPEAVLRAEMPTSLAAARTQNLRWEAGRRGTLRRQALPLLARGVRARKVAMIDAAVEQLVPPLSVPAALLTVGLIAGVLLGLPVVWITAAALTLVLVLHVAAGLLLARAPLRVYRALLRAPLYMAWKVALYASVFRSRRERSWIRTQRVESG